VLCEPSANPLRVLQELVGAMLHTGRLRPRSAGHPSDNNITDLVGSQRLAGEVVDAPIEAALHKTRVKLHKVLHLIATNQLGVLRRMRITDLLLLDDLGHVSLFRAIEL
jgi:hypothetical protein